MTPVVFKGEFHNDRIEGDGIMKLSNGDIILGNFKDGLPVRKIQCKYANGDQYIGNLAQNGNRVGNGILINKTGTYEGPFKNNLKHGRGSLITENYEIHGEFILDKFVTGEFIDKHGNKFKSAKSNQDSDSKGKEFEDGLFVKGRLEGMGSITYANGEKYEGSFKDGKRYGKGIMHYLVLSKFGD